MPRRRAGATAFSRAIMWLAVLAPASAGAGYVMAAREFSIATVGEQISEAAVSTMIAAGFGIAQASLTGQQRANEAEIFDALDLGNVRAFWQLDAAAALKRIERVAWVESAQISRVYPSRLEIEIKERTPAAVWSRGGARHLVDATGRVLEILTGDAPTSLPQIAGEGANVEIAQLVGATARHPEIATRIAVSERIAERRWRIVLKNGSRIELAAEREVEGLDRVAETPAAVNALAGDAVVVDVRTPGRIVIGPLTSAPGHISEARRP